MKMIRAVIAGTLFLGVLITHPIQAGTEDAPVKQYQGNSVPDDEAIVLSTRAAKYKADLWEAQVRAEIKAQDEENQRKERAVERTATPGPPVVTQSTENVWDRLAQCEAGGNWAANTGNGYSGGLQFHSGTWSNYGGQQFAPAAWQASREDQITVAERVLAAEGWGAWPACSRHIGMR